MLSTASRNGYLYKIWNARYAPYCISPHYGRNALNDIFSMQNTVYQVIKQAIKQRRAIFPPSYIKKEIPKTLLVELLECANTAPTHKLTQPWRFIIFRENGREKLADQLAEQYKT
ncbi:MAG: hypothetical protein EAS52_04195, partial [Parapedobacter sp.]